MITLARFLLTACLIAAPIGAAHAAGCLKGAVVGGVAGHFVRHPVVGAAVGCAIGHHRAVVQQREQRQQDRDSRLQTNRGSEGRY